MLLLVTILLVVVGTISLVIGFVQSSLLPIYISIACSVLAAVVLLIFSRMTAKSQQVVTSGGPAPLDTGSDRGPERDRTEPVPAFVGTGLLEGREGSSSGEAFAPEERHGSSSRFDEVPDDELTDTGTTADIDDDFPIERYDQRRVGEILPLLAELDLDELDIVREHEEQGKSRATVLARIDQLIDQLEAEDRQEAASRFDDEPADDPVPAFAPGAAGDIEEPGDVVDERDELDDEPVTSAPAPPLPTQAVTVAALPDDDGYFPIEEYDDLRASEILPLLPELDDDELEMVRAREQAGAARSSILRRIDVLSGSDEGAAAPDEPEPTAAFEPVPAVVPEAPVKRAPTKRTPTKRAPAAKAEPAKKATTPRRGEGTAATPVKKAATVKKATSKAAAKKVAQEPTTAVSTTRAAKKASAGTGPVGKSAAAKKSAAAAKAAPAKRTASKAGGAPAAAKASTKASKATRKGAKS